MASLAEIRAKLKEQEARAGGNQGPSGPNPIYPFWNIKEGESATFRFLPVSNANSLCTPIWTPIMNSFFSSLLFSDPISEPHLDLLF